MIEAPAQATVLGEITGGQLLLGLRQVKWRTVHLCDSSDDVNHKAEWLRKNKPDVLVALRLYNADHTQRTRPHQCTAQGQSEACLVGNHLGRAAQ